MATASLPFTCEQCGTRFEPLAGGCCSRCGRTLCLRHLYGRLALKRWLRSDPPVCAGCAGVGSPPGPTPT
jgi:hypothetical protein